jgi:hypothetical protein
MNRSRRWSARAGLVLLAGLLSADRGHAQTPEKKGDGTPVEKWLLDRSLTVTPARAPVSALKYRFYPPETDRCEGNAVPMYLRFAHERGDARKKLLREKPEEWNKLPLDKLPLAEVRQFLDGYSYNLRQLELGARRKTADWSYSLDAGDAIGIRLPDAQEMRMHAPLLVLKARVEIAEGRLADAARTLETGFSFGQQVSEEPFLVNTLIGNCLFEYADTHRSFYLAFRNSVRLDRFRSSSADCAEVPQIPVVFRTVLQGLQRRVEVVKCLQFQGFLCRTGDRTGSNGIQEVVGSIPISSTVENANL